MRFNSHVTHATLFFPPSRTEMRRQPLAGSAVLHCAPLISANTRHRAGMGVPRPSPPRYPPAPPRPTDLPRRVVPTHSSKVDVEFSPPSPPSPFDPEGPAEQGRRAGLYMVAGINFTAP